MHSVLTYKFTHNIITQLTQTRAILLRHHLVFELDTTLKYTKSIKSCVAPEEKNYIFISNSPQINRKKVIYPKQEIYSSTDSLVNHL